MRRCVVRILLVALVIVPPLAFGAQRLCTSPLSLTAMMGPAAGAALPPGAAVQPSLASTTGVEPPAWLALVLADRLPAPTGEDLAYYWLHAALGGLLDGARCDATASGVQWVKAAIHARSVEQAERAVGGIRGAVARAADPVASAQRLCLVASPRNWRSVDHVALTLVMAGVYCNPSVTPAPVRESGNATVSQG
jgi:hypothetical protein